MEIPTAGEVARGCQAFELHESRDAMYKTARFLVDHFWGRPAEMADSLGVLLLTWNQAHYRYGSFDFRNLESCIAKNLDVLEGYRAKSVLTHAAEDEQHVKDLFHEFMLALAIAGGKSKGKQSPVAVAKALHLLAPSFFPIWDQKIASKYGCHYSVRPAEKYIRFMRLSQGIARRIQSDIEPKAGKTLLKFIDEYNYARFTKGWI